MFQFREHWSGEQIPNHHATPAIYSISEGFIQSAAEDFQALWGTSVSQPSRRGGGYGDES